MNGNRTDQLQTGMPILAEGLRHFERVPFETCRM